MNHNRNIYLKMHSLNKAKKLISKHFENTFSEKKEIIPTNESLERILAEPITSKISHPCFNAAAMDGVAVKAENTFNACETNPQELTLGEDTYYVNTGQIMPEGSNAVIMIEHVQILDEKKLIIENPVYPWQNVRKMGEDIIATELLYTRNHKITPYCIGALISAGIYQVPVRKKPKILIIPTGSEIIDWKKIRPEYLKPGQILETNSYVLEKIIEKCGGQCIRHEIIPDNLHYIEKTVSEASKSDFDIILTLGGSSAGSQDYALAIVKKLGEILIHGVSIMPGKPIIAADINSKPFFGIPGYPVSAIIAFEQFVSPLIHQMLRIKTIQKKTINAVPFRKITSKVGIEEFLRVKIGKIGPKTIAIPLPRGAGMITSITEADGVVRIPEQIEGINESEEIKVELFKSQSAIDNTITAIGSHDNSMAILSDELKKIDPSFNLSSTHIGSMGGLISIKKNLCHIAGVHLLDEETGEYNVSYVKQYLKNIDVNIINLVTREQGLIVAKNNPKNIQSITDLVQKKITFVNRQKGSGTRILLDYKLAQFGISSKNIAGYSREEFTHMDIAMAILSGTADVGIGIQAASYALDLDFIPIIEEQYDLVIRKERFKSRKIETLIQALSSDSFKNKINNMRGYSTRNTGSIIM